MSKTIFSEKLKKMAAGRIGPYFYVIMPDGKIQNNDSFRTPASFAASPQFKDQNYSPDDIVRFAYDPSNHSVYFIDFDVEDMQKFETKINEALNPSGAKDQDKNQIALLQFQTLSEALTKKDQDGNNIKPMVSPGTVEDLPYARKISDYSLLKTQLEQEVEERGAKFVDIPVIELPKEIAKNLMRDKQDTLFIMGEIRDPETGTLRYSGQKLNINAEYEPNEGSFGEKTRKFSTVVEGPAIIINRDGFRPSSAPEDIKRTLELQERVEDPVDYGHMQGMIYATYHAHLSNIIYSDSLDNKNTVQDLIKYNNQFVKYISHGQSFFDFYFLAYNPETGASQKFNNPEKLSSEDLTNAYKDKGVVCLSYAYKPDDLGLGIYIFPDQNIDDLKNQEYPLHGAYKTLQSEMDQKIESKTVEEAGDRFWDLDDEKVQNTIMTIKVKRIKDYPLLWSYIVNVVAPHYQIPKKELMKDANANIQVVSMNAPIGAPGTKAAYVSSGELFPKEVTNFLKKEIVDLIQAPVILIDARWKTNSSLAASIVHEYAHHLGFLYFFGELPPSYGTPPSYQSSSENKFKFFKTYLGDEQEKLAHSVEMEFQKSLGIPEYKILDLYSDRKTDMFSVALRSLYRDVMSGSGKYNEEIIEKFKGENPMEKKTEGDVKKEAQIQQRMEDVNRWWNQSTEYGISPFRGNPIGEGNNEGAVHPQLVYDEEVTITKGPKISYEEFALQSWNSIIKPKFSTERRLENERNEYNRE